jgi:hypothetical protein
VGDPGLKSSSAVGCCSAGEAVYSEEDMESNVVWEVAAACAASALVLAEIVDIGGAAVEGRRRKERCM